MKIIINSRSGVPIYRQIVQQIENGIIGGILSPGEQLPTVREVALQLTVNPNTVARAYRELEYRGLIESTQGRGTFVSTGAAFGRIEERELIFKQKLESVLQEACQLNISQGRAAELFHETLKHWKQEE